MSALAPGTHDLDNAAARAHYETRVRELAAFGHRGSATSNEQAAAAYLMEQLRGFKLDPQLEQFAGLRSLALRCVLHLFIAAVGGYFLHEAPLVSAGVALLALISMLVEFSTKGVWLSRLLPHYPSCNVVATASAARPKQRIILAAHYDTQQTGLIWFLFQYLSPLFWMLPAWLKPPLLAAALTMVANIALGVMAWMQVDVSEPWYWLLGFYLGLLIAMGEWAIHTHVPGAGDNASGVAAILAFVEAWQQNPHEDVELAIVFPGCEEAGLIGSTAWAVRHVADNARLPTRFLIMDNLGMGPPRYLGAEIPMVGCPVTYPAAEIHAAQSVAEEMGLSELGPWTVPAPGDALSFLQRRLPGMSILSFHRWGYMPFYHLKGDTAEHLDFDAAWLAVRYGWKLLQRFANEAQDRRARTSSSG